MPNMAMGARKDRRNDPPRFRSRTTRMGRSGLVVRRSMTTKTASRTTAAMR